MNIGTMIKRLQDIMRQDAGVNGDAQRIEQIVWMLFLKIYDAKESEWEILEDNYKSIIPEEYRWRNWAPDNKDGKAITGDEMSTFIIQLFAALKDLEVDENTDVRRKLVKEVFTDLNNYMKDGILVRQVVNVLNEIDLTDFKVRHAFNEIYETILKDLQSAKSSGEFYTPRAVTDFMVEMVKPKIGEKVADFACGTGGFLVSALNYMKKEVDNTNSNEQLQNSFYGVEKKSLPYLLCTTNMLLHDVNEPLIIRGNSLEKNVRDYDESDKFDIILMNPPYGGTEKNSIKNNFPSNFRTTETANLFMIEIYYRLKNTGRCAVVLPESFLVDTGNISNFKEELFKNFNLHTVVKMPDTTFAPYANVSTYLLFIDGGTPTEKVWFYEFQYPKGMKSYSKTNPIKFKDFLPIIDWWDSREESEICWSMSIDDIINNNYSLICNNPNKRHKQTEYDPVKLCDKVNDNLVKIEENFKKIKSTINDVRKYHNFSKYRIEDIFNFERGILQSSKCVPGEYNFITASEEWKKHNEYTHDCEAIIFACAASGSLGRTHYVNGKFISSDLCYILTPKMEVDLLLYKYIFDFIKSDIVSKTATGSAKKAINAKNFANYELPYFSYNDQLELRKILINIQNLIDASSDNTVLFTNMIKYIFNIKDSE